MSWAFTRWGEKILDIPSQEIWWMGSSSPQKLSLILEDSLVLVDDLDCQRLVFWFPELLLTYCLDGPDWLTEFWLQILFCGDCEVGDFWILDWTTGALFCVFWCRSCGLDEVLQGAELFVCVVVGCDGWIEVWIGVIFVRKWGGAEIFFIFSGTSKDGLLGTGVSFTWLVLIASDTEPFLKLGLICWTCTAWSVSSNQCKKRHEAIVGTKSISLL